MNCPVCDTPLNPPLCPKCGYDRSRDYERYPTFGVLPSAPAAVSRLRSHRSNTPPATDFVRYSSGKRRITAVAAGGSHTVVLYADGTAAAVGSNRYGQCNVEHWKKVLRNIN